jgi:Spy/CpxP family protein refolding chaperone
MRFLPVFCLSALLVAAPALAQTAAPDQGSPAAWHHHDGKPGERFRAHLAELEAKLNLTPAQKPLWDAYVDVVKQTMRARFEHFHEMRNRPPADAPSQLDNRLAMLQHEIDATGREKQALTPLWAALDSGQQATLSQALAWHPHGGRDGKKWAQPPQ